MLEMLSSLLQMDLSDFGVSNDLIFLSCFILAVLIIFEVFNMLRSVVSYFFDRR